jgi:hypothetical protein
VAESHHQVREDFRPLTEHEILELLLSAELPGTEETSRTGRLRTRGTVELWVRVLRCIDGIRRAIAEWRTGRPLQRQWRFCRR